MRGKYSFIIFYYVIFMSTRVSLFNYF